jgi:antitoxin (DNA-binding transcriptional repressor) of toxin-antitoxin stability system
MATVDISKAEEQFEKWIEAAERGEEVILARAGNPVARLTNFMPEKKPIRFGALKGKSG